MTSGPRVVQKFHPNTGVFTGYVGMGVAVIVLGTLVFQARDSEGLQYGLGVLLAAGAVWVAILRPRAYATSKTLVLRNMLSDIHIPLASVETVMMRQTLNVWAGGKRYVCLGIGKTRRELTGRQRRGTGIPFARTPDLGDGPSTANTKINYEDFVVDRILDLSKEAKQTDPNPGQVARVIAWPEVIGLVSLAGAFVASLLAF
jgi:hypothetical protein